MRATEVVSFALALVSTAPAAAANVAIDSDMEAAGIAAWPHVDVTGTSSSAKASDRRQSGIQSLKGTSSTGRAVTVEWANRQTIGTVTGGYTVRLSLWHGSQFNASVTGASGTFYVDVKPTAASSWVTVWSAAVTPSIAFAAGTATSVDVSSAFGATASYDLQLRFAGKTGRDTGASINTWWDDVIVDVRPPNVPPETTLAALPAVISASSYSLGGTASDSDGTVTGVKVQIQRGDTSQYWAGGAWQPSAIELDAASSDGFATWAYAWAGFTGLDGVAVTVRARAGDGTAYDASPAQQTTTVDNRAPLVASGVRFEGPPAAGASFILLSDWTESSPGTPAFQYDLNGAGWSLSAASENGGSNSARRTFGVALDGNDFFGGIRSQHADAFGNGPTTSESLAEVLVTPRTPPAPTLGSVTGTSLRVAVNPAETLSPALGYAILEAGGSYVQGDGTLGAAEYWGHPAGTVTVTGLAPATTYGFAVAAANPRDTTPTLAESSTSVFGPTAAATTSSTLNEAPETALDKPPATVRTLTYTFTGTASDPDGAVTSVLLTIVRQDSSEYWNGSAWQAGAVEVPAASTGGEFATWQYVWNQIGVMSNVTVSVQARAYDGSAHDPTPAARTTAVDNTGAEAVSPVGIVFAPAAGAVVGGMTLVRIDAYDPAQLHPTAPVQVSFADAWDAASRITLAGENPHFGLDLDATHGVYDLFWDTVNGVTADDGTSVIGATGADASATRALYVRVYGADGVFSQTAQSVSVKNVGGKPAGSGNLLRREPSGAVCLSCHRVKTHGSSELGIKYGAWGFDCYDCHTAHGTANLMLVRSSISTPASGARAVDLRSVTGGRVDGGLAELPDPPGTNGIAAGNGVCEVCHTQTRNADGTPCYRNTGEGPNGHATGNCLGCHEHATGFRGGGSCDSCHYAPPHTPSLGDVHLTHGGALGVPASYGEVASGSTAASYGFPCGKCHPTAGAEHLNDTLHAGTAADPKVVQVDGYFDSTAEPEVDVSASVDPSYTPGTPYAELGPEGQHFLYTGGTCANVYCHGEFAGGNTANDPVFQTGTQPCGACHGASTATTPSGGAHPAHVGALRLSCKTCHEGTVDATPAIVDRSRHVDGAATWDLDRTSALVGAAAVYGGAEAGGKNPPSATYSSCASVYCHSNGNPVSGPTAPYAVFQTVSWGATLAGCTSCHGGAGTSTSPTLIGGSGAATKGSVAHVDHVDTGRYAFRCADCHRATMNDRTSDTVLAPGQTTHVDGAPSVGFGTFPLDQSAGTWSAATHTCGATYCHSAGNDFTAPYAEARAVAWTDTVGCAGCHGTTLSAGAPSYANGSPKANSHAAHRSYACQSCHAAVVDPTPAVVGFAQHVDGGYDVAAGAGATFGATVGQPGTPTTCSDISCHGGAGTAATWGGTLGCTSCHSGVEVAYTELHIRDGVSNAIDDEWTTRGHGSAVGGSFASAMGGCDYCHDPDAAHIPTAATNPYRLRTDAVGAYAFAATDNSLCLACHGASDASDPGIAVSSRGAALSPEDDTRAAGAIGTAHWGPRHAGVEGGLLCWDCHDPHGDPNIKMIRAKVVVQRDATDAAYGVPGAGVDDTHTVAFTGNATAADFTRASGVPRQGMCQACHSPSKGDPSLATGSVKWWRWDGTDYDSATSQHNAATVCTQCHAHDDDFAGKGDDCLSCHRDGAAKGTFTRRAVGADFGGFSHHVGNGGTYMGGTLTNFDCVVCHREGDVDTTTTPDEVKTSDTYHGGNGGALTIDLRQADTNVVLAYDKHAVCLAAGGTDAQCKDTSANIVSPASWGSGNAAWQTESANRLDPFCLSCHDADGATHLASAPNDGGGTAMNPFADARITNEYDRVTRVDAGYASGRVVDVASRVSTDWPVGPGGIDPADRDLATEPRGPDDRADPPQGIYSRHAIRGQSGSVYGSTIGGVPASYYVGSWNDTSVMGCADCHTSDGGNGPQGNAHGSRLSEYLLKDATGTATLGSSTTTYVCARCHTAAAYVGGTHTENAGDFQDYVGALGAARVPVGASGGNIYGTACTNCHGGGYETAGDTTPQFGTIHGTSQIMDVYAKSGKVGTRQAYRFTNGNSMRFYQPDTDGALPWNWAAASATCVTLSAGDTFGGCTKHPGGTTLVKPVVRELKY